MGGSWLEKIKRHAKEMAQPLSHPNPLIDAPYELICQDLGLEAECSAAHTAVGSERLSTGEAFSMRGGSLTENAVWVFRCSSQLFCHYGIPAGWSSRPLARLGGGQTYHAVPLWGNGFTRRVEDGGQGLANRRATSTMVPICQTLSPRERRR